VRTADMRRALFLSACVASLPVAALYLLRPPPPAPAPPLQGALVAHRAGLAHAPENSLSAVRYAADAGAGAVELDVRWDAGELVCAHDAWQAPGAPRLSEMLDLALSRGLLVELDLKTGPLGDRALIHEVSQAILARQAPDRVWVSTFQPLAAWQLRREAPEIALGWPLPSTGWAWLDVLASWDGPARWMGASVLEPHEALVTQRRLARWTQRWPVEVWVVHDPVQVEALREQGLAVVVDHLHN
jgi:glycerophosphoryl diester phosphodiesterase